jgi:hypothetical protein
MSVKKNNGWITDIILIDIINFSHLKSAEQLEIISFLSKSYSKMINKMLLNSSMTLDKLILGYISTGDGFYCILNPRLKGYGTILGLSFNHFSDQIAKIFPYFEGIKVAVHTGEIYEFKDILGHTNYIGDGLNDCARYLEIKDYAMSTVMVSNPAYQQFEKFLDIYKNYNDILIDREFKFTKPYSFKDKHGFQKHGRMVWLRKSGIINPPNININSVMKGI